MLRSAKSAPLCGRRSGGKPFVRHGKDGRGRRKRHRRPKYFRKGSAVPGIGRRRHGAVADRTAGEAKSVPAEAGLASCETGEPLEPGAYELYARVMVIPD